MNKLVGALISFVALCLVILGAIFIVAWSVENAVAGGLMVLIGVGLLFYVYKVEKIEAAKPEIVSQTFNVKMSGSGSLATKNMTCRSCGAPLGEKNVKVVKGGLMASCPYCGVTSAFQEAPKW